MPSCRPILSKDKQFFVHPTHFSIVQPSRHQPINRKHVEAYHIRPQHGRNYMLNDDDVFVVIISFSPTSGRMQYAPTPVRLISGLTSSWQNRRNGCDDADSGHTKPSKRLRRCWLGSHKTPETVATMLTRVTQNPRNSCDDAYSGHTKPPKRLRRCWLGSHKTLETVATTKLCSHSLVNAIATVKMLHRSQYRC